MLPDSGRVDPLESGSSGNVDRFDLSATADTRHLGGGTVQNSKRGAGSPLGSAQLSAPLKGRHASRGPAAGGGPVLAGP